MTDTLHEYSNAELGALLPLPAPDANKYTRGRLLIVAGNRRYGGAAQLAAMAAIRSGAGYVTLATIAPVAAAVRTLAPTVPVVELPESAEGGIRTDDESRLIVQKLAAQHDAVLLGPGLGRAPATLSFIRELTELENFAPNSDELHRPPLVLDADALFAFSGHLDELPHDYPLVLTPHAGELKRLTGNHEPASARPLATGARTVVAKGPRTHMYAQDFAALETTAPPTLATAGTGDVLAGIIAALLAQGLSATHAVTLGVRLHSLAAVAAADALTALCVHARDVIDYLPAAAHTLIAAAAAQQK